MVKVWFSVLIYQIFKAFKEAMEYILLEVTITRLNFFNLIFFTPNLIKGLSKGKKCKK